MQATMGNQANTCLPEVDRTFEKISFHLEESEERTEKLAQITLEYLEYADGLDLYNDDSGLINY